MLDATLKSQLATYLGMLRQPIRRVLKTAILGACAPQARFEMLSLHGAETIEQCRVRAIELSAQLSAWTAAQAADASAPQKVLWVEAFSQSVQLHQTPLSIAPIFSKQREGPPRSWIFTSATLGDDPRLRWFTEPCGLESA